MFDSETRIDLRHRIDQTNSVPLSNNATVNASSNFAFICTETALQCGPLWALPYEKSVLQRNLLPQSPVRINDDYVRQLNVISECTKIYIPNSKLQYFAYGVIGFFQKIKQFIISSYCCYRTQQLSGHCSSEYQLVFVISLSNKFTFLIFNMIHNHI